MFGIRMSRFPSVIDALGRFSAKYVHAVFTGESVPNSIREDIWSQFAINNGTIHDLGRPAIFLLPKEKLQYKLDGQTVREIIEKFLVEQFQAFSAFDRQSFGYWQDGERVIHYDECVEFEVAFVGKERIPVLVEFLLGICGQIQEQCLYFKAGQYASTIWPE